MNPRGPPAHRRDLEAARVSHHDAARLAFRGVGRPPASDL